MSLWRAVRCRHLGSFCAPCYFGALLPAALEPTAVVSAYISTAIDRLTGPRNDFSKLNDPFSTGSILTMST
jgi:hypothetical protein